MGRSYRADIRSAVPLIRGKNPHMRLPKTHQQLKLADKIVDLLDDSEYHCNRKQGRHRLVNLPTSWDDLPLSRRVFYYREGKRVRFTGIETD